MYLYPGGEKKARTLLVAPGFCSVEIIIFFSWIIESVLQLFEVFISCKLKQNFKVFPAQGMEWGAACGKKWSGIAFLTEP